LSKNRRRQTENKNFARGLKGLGKIILNQTILRIVWPNLVLPDFFARTGKDDGTDKALI